MSVVIRQAQDADFDAMANLLNKIIAIGGTTAMTKPVTPDDLLEKSRKPRSRWTVAILDGRLIGFQWIAPNDDLPEGAADIASFVDPEIQGQGTGAKLIEATKDAARNLGYAWINATIRADNVPGLGYYSKQGFSDWNKQTGTVLDDGTQVDRIMKRLDL
jgi:GNAT superfamily N-acetyltransferase